MNSSSANQDAIVNMTNNAPLLMIITTVIIAPFLEEMIFRVGIFQLFYNKYRSLIDKLDVENIEMVAFHVTTCNDECAEIKKNGLQNLQWVLSNDTALCRFLKEYDISFDIESKLMYIGGTAFDVDYEKYTDLDVISRRKEQLHKIGHNTLSLFT